MPISAHTAVIAILLTFFSIAFNNSTWAKAPRPPVQVFAEPIKTESYTARIEALGTLKAREAVTLSALVTKTIQAIHFDDNQRVKQGDVLVEMASREEHAQLKEAEVTTQEAKRQYQRVKLLQKRNLAADSLLDEKRLAYDTARAKLEAVQARLADRTVIAPFDGVMGLRQVSLGTLVKPGDPIATLDDDRAMKLDMTIPAVYLSTVTVGMLVNAKSPDLAGEVFHGTIASIDSRIDPQTRSITIRALLKNPQRKLVPGMLMQVELEQPAIQYLMLPEEALIQEGTNSFAFVVNQTEKPATVEKRKLITGPRNNGHIAITEGLVAGEWIVTRGTMRLNSGAAVFIKNSTADQKNTGGDK